MLKQLMYDQFCGGPNSLSEKVEFIIDIIEIIFLRASLATQIIRMKDVLKTNPDVLILVNVLKIVGAKNSSYFRSPFKK